MSTLSDVAAYVRRTTLELAKQAGLSDEEAERFAKQGDESFKEWVGVEDRIRQLGAACSQEIGRRAPFAYPDE